MTKSLENKKVIDESFEVHSFALSQRVRKYEKISDLVHMLHNAPSADDIYCAAHCIFALADRLDQCRTTRDALAAKLRVL